jgi:hypothetical protein
MIEREPDDRRPAHSHDGGGALQVNRPPKITAPIGTLPASARRPPHLVPRLRHAVSGITE